MSNPQYPGASEQVQPQVGYGQPGLYGAAMAMPNQQVRLAGIGARFLALLIDIIVVSIPIGILTPIILAGSQSTAVTTENSVSYSISGPQVALWPLVNIVVLLAYYILCYMFLDGCSLGQKLLGLRLVNATTRQKASLGSFLVYRTIGYAINGFIFAIGWIWAIFDRNKQTWGQKLTSTITIVAPR